MNEELMHRIMMFAGMVLAILAGLGSIVLLAETAMDFSMATLFATVLMAGASIGFGWGAVYFGGRTTGQIKVFSADIEREVLNPKQRRDLKRARGEVVMERALVDIENERQNIVHKQIESSNDPAKPPHVTSFTPHPEGQQRELRGNDYERY